MTVEPEYVARTLAWCNEIRAERGKGALSRLPKGRRSDGRSCPCGSATGATVGLADWCFPHETSRLLPLAVQEFVRAFDDGKLPQYDKEVAA